ncbi:DUF502 domain-containing protein [Brevirhabdus sp.]|uniref:DUF502 domain-containing protein n=1 Tax=Brevirhabdus sp. TaxID=2004514 RepID=UPI00405A25FC
MTKKEPDDRPEIKRRRPGIFARLRSSFLAGLIIVVPVALTMWLVWTVTGTIDSWVLPLVPHQLQPSQYIGINLRGVGVVIFLIFTVVMGWLAKGFLGRSLIRLGEGIVDRMPVVRSIYNGLKQIVETALSQGETSFDKACLVQYPREGIWALAFVSTSAKGEVRARIPTEENILSVFLPTTPNPTSGFLLFVPERDVIYLDMTVESAAKLVISAGLVYPNPKDPTKPSVPASSLDAEDRPG